MAETQQRRKFGLDPKTGRLAIAGLQVPMPRSRVGRIGVGSGLIVGGVLGFLPILGFWMLPLGVVVLSNDVSLLRRWRRRTTLWWGRRKTRGR